MVLFNKIKQLRIPGYNIYSSTLLYKNVSIYTALRGGDRLGSTQMTTSQWHQYIWWTGIFMRWWIPIWRRIVILRTILIWIMTRMIMNMMRTMTVRVASYRLPRLVVKGSNWVTWGRGRKIFWERGTTVMTMILKIWRKRPRSFNPRSNSVRYYGRGLNRWDTKGQGIQGV